ncbi:MAG: leucine-rich repeat domain-containing protein [Oscillospiraceae bacterium]|jgi:hypothetical protein|nr:leucine-rich repeat domain-containing protein [Oscillospiraceae bacterium]
MNELIYKDLFKYVVENRKISIKMVTTRNIEEVVIPEEIDIGVKETYPIVRIGAHAFKECKKLKTVSLPDTLKEINESAFKGCEQLESINLPKSLAVISGGTFSLCKNLSDIEIPENVQGIGAGAFSGCRKLETVTVPKNVRSVQDKAFSDCTALKEVVILSDKLKALPKIFFGCVNIKKFILAMSSAVDLTFQPELTCVKNIFLRTAEGTDIPLYMPTAEKYSCREEGKPADESYVKIFSEGFTWENYDNTFDEITYDSEKGCDVAAYRLYTKADLSEGMCRTYEKYLKKHRKTAIGMFIDFEDTGALKVLSELGLFSKWNIRKYIKLAAKNKKPQAERFLQFTADNC